MLDLITVIVCIYNRERFLKKCIESIICQTYSNIDILLIDDGSTDNSLEICKEYQKSDKRIRIIHQENQGISITRNVGIKNALGKYVCFVDSDDYIDKAYCEELYKSIKENDSDMSICDIMQINTNTNKEYLIDKEIDSFCVSGKDVMGLLFYKRRISNPINKLYKLSILKQIEYPSKSIHEDTYIIYDILKKCKKVSYINKPLYYRIIHENSIMSTANKSRLDQIKAFEHWENEFKKDGDIKNYHNSIMRGMNSIILNYTMLYKILETSEKNELISKFNEKYKICKNLAFKYRIKFILFKSFPKIFAWVYRGIMKDVR